MGVEKKENKNGLGILAQNKGIRPNKRRKKRKGGGMD